MKTKASRKDIVVLISILVNLITASSKDFSKQLSRYSSPLIRRLADESDFEHIVYRISVYLCCSYIEQTISPNIAAETLTASLLAYMHRESFMSNISQMELSVDLSFITELEKSVIRTPVMSDTGYYNELCRFAVLKAQHDEQTECIGSNILNLIDLDIGKKLELWVAKTINEISIAYNSAMAFIPHKRKKDSFRNAEVLIVFAVLLVISVKFISGLVADSREQKLDDYSEAYVQGYNTGALEGARCGIDWVYESFGKTVPDVDYADIIAEYSFYSFPLDEYYE